MTSSENQGFEYQALCGSDVKVGDQLSVNMSIEYFVYFA